MPAGEEVGEAQDARVVVEAHREHQCTVPRECASAVQQVGADLHGDPRSAQDIVEAHDQGGENGTVGDRVVQLLAPDVGDDSTGDG